MRLTKLLRAYSIEFRERDRSTAFVIKSFYPSFVVLIAIDATSFGRGFTTADVDEPLDSLCIIDRFDP